MTVRKGELSAATGILADIARNAALADEEIERQRAVAVDGVTVAMSNPGAVAQMAAMRALYGKQPYGHPANGTVASLKAISRSDIGALYRNGWTPANVTLLFSGDVTPVQARALAY
jgi:zinc protease